MPVSLTGALLRTLAVAGLGWAIANLAPRRSLRAFLYAVIVLCGMVMGAAVFWVTGMQILARRSWGHDGIQGFALLFLFGFVGMLYLAVWRSGGSMWRTGVRIVCGAAGNVGNAR